MIFTRIRLAFLGERDMRSFRYRTVNSPPAASEPIGPSAPCIAAGDQVPWFEMEIHPCEPGLRGWLRKRFPWLSDVDDLVQESYLRLFRARKRGAVQHARSYLYTTASNAAVDLVRRRRSDPIEDRPGIEAADILEDGPLLVESVCHAEEIELLAQAVHGLPQKRRAVLMLCKLGGHSHREIADMLGISENTVSTHLTLAMRQCREFLEVRGVKGSGR